jgi:hypothetical protein
MTGKVRLESSAQSTDLISIESYSGRAEGKGARNPTLTDSTPSGSSLVKNWSHEKVVERKHNHAVVFYRERCDRLAATEV